MLDADFAMPAGERPPEVACGVASADGAAVDVPGVVGAVAMPREPPSSAVLASPALRFAGGGALGEMAGAIGRFASLARRLLTAGEAPACAGVGGAEEGGWPVSGAVVVMEADAQRSPPPR